MNKEQLEAALEQLHNKKERIGKLSYGEASGMKHAANSLIQKIVETTSFLLAIDLPDELAQARKQAIDTIDTAFGAIQQEHAIQKSDHRGHEVVTKTMDSQSTLIREALRKFDTAALAWLNRQG